MISALSSTHTQTHTHTHKVVSSHNWPSPLTLFMSSSCLMKCNLLSSLAFLASPNLPLTLSPLSFPRPPLFLLPYNSPHYLTTPPNSSVNLSNATLLSFSYCVIFLSISHSTIFLPFFLSFHFSLYHLLSTLLLTLLSFFLSFYFSECWCTWWEATVRILSEISSLLTRN